MSEEERRKQLAATPVMEDLIEHHKQQIAIARAKDAGEITCLACGSIEKGHLDLFPLCTGCLRSLGKLRRIENL